MDGPRNRNQNHNRWRRPRADNGNQNENNNPNQNQNQRRRPQNNIQNENNNPNQNRGQNEQRRPRPENNNQNENNNLNPGRGQNGRRRPRPENENNNPNQNQWRRPRVENNNQNENQNPNQNGRGPGSEQNGARNRRERNNNDKTEVRHPIGYKTLQNLLETTNDSELILKLSSKSNGFLLLLDQQSIKPDFMCLILAALAKASKSSTERSTVQFLVHLYMEIVPKLGNQSSFYRELKLFISDWGIHCAITSSQRQKHIDAVENLLIFLRRVQLMIYQKSFEPIRNLMEPISAQIEYINRKGNALNDFIVTTMNQLNNSVENFQQMREETEVDILLNTMKKM